MPQLNPANSYHSNGGDFYDVLKTLLNPTADPRTAADNLGGSTLQALGAAGQSPNDAVGANQQDVLKALLAKSAEKALTKHLDSQALQLLSTHPEGMSILASHVNPGAVGLDNGYNQAKDESSSQSADQSIETSNIKNGSQNSTQNNIQQQALDIIKPSTSFFGKLMENLGNAGIIRNQQLQNLALAQKISAGQPGEISLPQAQTSGLLQAQAGETPIQPEQAATLRGAQNTAQITAMQDTISNLQKRRDSLNTEFEAEGKTMSALGKLGGLITFQGQQMTPRQRAIKTEQSGIDKVIARMQSKMSGYTPENPAALKGTPGNIPPAPDGATHYSPSTKKFYNERGMEIK